MALRRQTLTASLRARMVSSELCVCVLVYTCNIHVMV